MVNLSTSISNWLPGRAKTDEQPCSEDLFASSPKVVTLNTKNFKDSVKKADAALVMFYDPCDKNCREAHKHVITASKFTKRDNHAYFGVNCRTDPDICSREKVTGVPFYRLYSKGQPVSTIKDFYNFKPLDMKRFVELCPLLDNGIQPRPPCDLNKSK